MRTVRDGPLAPHAARERERGADSPWRHYIDLLPDHVPSGRHFTDGELRATQSD